MMGNKLTKEWLKTTQSRVYEEESESHEMQS